MAKRRMFSTEITDSDAFLDLPLSAQALYYHLGMKADDEGFINNSKMILRIIKANQEDLDLLIEKRFLIDFKTGVIVIKHWRINNYIQKDRKTPTLYIEERAKIKIKSNNVYTLYTGCTQDVRVGKVREDKVSIGEVSIGEREESISDVFPLTPEELESLFKKYGTTKVGDYIKKVELHCKSTGKKYKDYAATIEKWIIDDGAAL